MEKYLEKLEFNKITSDLAEHAITSKGKEFAHSLSPMNNINDLKKSLETLTEANTLIYRKGNIPMYSFSDITVHLKALHSASSLSIGYLLDLANILKLARLLKEYIKEDSSLDLSFCKHILTYFNNLYINSSIENRIFSSIIDENTIDDNASKELLSIRRNLRNTESEVKRKLTSFLNSKYVQEPVVTIRSGRFVIPVKNEYRSEVKGFIHDISASGSTVFIEPMAVFELNNAINTLKLEENLEIEKILLILTSLFFDLTSELENNVNLLGMLDFIFAKAKYGIAIDSVEPILNENKFINLIKARNPLINKDHVVPIDVSIGKDYNSLIVTGPNTGGKTVTLKTVGLLCAMAMSGLYIPASENSSVPVFDNIYSDIGDNQSIQESLSTFSAHMVTIINILSSVTGNSLVLLDELRFWYRPYWRL